MKVVAFNGSPKGKNSNSSVIVNAFLSGAGHAGAQTEEIHLIDYNINHCTGCFACWFKTPGKCIFRDDMDQLLAKYMQADIVCFATPVYTWNMTAVLKNFIDRLAPLKSPTLMQANGNYDLKDTQTKNTRFIVIANAGFPGENNFDTINKVFSSCQPILKIYRNCGMALKKEDSRVKFYLKTVEDAAVELIRNDVVSRETELLLQRELIPLQEYIHILGM